MLSALVFTSKFKATTSDTPAELMLGNVNRLGSSTLKRLDPPVSTSENL